MAQKLGTYILNENGEPHLVLADRYFNKFHCRMSSFQATLPPITQPLPVSNNSDADVGIFYYLFLREGFPHNFHIYLKSALYAYKQMLRCTDIVETGKVRFFIDKRGRAEARPYFKATGLEDLVRYVDLQPWYTGSNYLWLPLSGGHKYFSHPDFQDVRYIFKFDVDLYFMNLGRGKKTKFSQVCDLLDKHPASMYGAVNFSAKERPMKDYYYTYSGQTSEDQKRIETAMQALFSAPFPADAERFMAGHRIGFRNHSESFRKYVDFYSKYGFMAKDEALLHAFLAFSDVEVGAINEDTGWLFIGCEIDSEDLKNNTYFMNMGHLKAMDEKYMLYLDRIHTYLTEDI